MATKRCDAYMYVYPGTTPPIASWGVIMKDSGLTIQGVGTGEINKIGVANGDSAFVILQTVCNVGTGSAYGKLTVTRYPDNVFNSTNVEIMAGSIGVAGIINVNCEQPLITISSTVTGVVVPVPTPDTPE